MALNIWIVMISCITLAIANPLVADSETREFEGDVIPSRYFLDIDVLLAFEGPYTYTYGGLVYIQFRAVREGVNAIVLQADQSLFIGDIVNIGRNVLPEFNMERSGDSFTLNLQNAIEENVDYVLAIEFSAPIRTVGNEGFYTTNVIIDGITHWNARTQFAPNHASKAFPCFDSSELPATFELAITRRQTLAPSNSNSTIIGRTQRDRYFVTETFRRTAEMEISQFFFSVTEAI